MHYSHTEQPHSYLFSLPFYLPYLAFLAPGQKDASILT